jgi:hypothetical protein
MMNRRWIIFAVAFVLSVVGLWAEEGVFLTPERLADRIAADARHWFPELASTPVFIDQWEPIPGGFRFFLQGKSPDFSDSFPLAVYEADGRSGKVWRRQRVAGAPVSTVEIGIAAALTSPPLREEERSGVSVHGVLRNLPGYILDSPGFLGQFLIWAEAGGRVVATQTELVGTTVYHLKGIPITAGSVAIKAKIRGYDLTILHPGVTLNPAQPVGVIGGIDIDFHQIQPILRDVRIVVRSNSDTQNPSFPAGARVRVIVRETGQSAEAVSANGWAEVLLPQVPTGWPLRLFAINLDAGYHSGELGPVVIPEDGGSVFTDSIVLE